MSTEVKVGKQRKFCDLPKHGDEKVVATVDGKTKMGPWANMCERCHHEVGVGLGLGKGQRLIYDD